MPAPRKPTDDQVEKPEPARVDVNDQAQQLEEKDDYTARAPGPDWADHVVVLKKTPPGPLMKLGWLLMTLLLAMLVGWCIGAGMADLGRELGVYA